MNAGGFGFGLICLAAFLYVSRYLCAAVYTHGMTTWSNETFNTAYGYVGPDLTIAAVIAFLIGLVFIFRGNVPRKRD